MAAVLTQLQDAVIARLAPLKKPVLGGGATGYLKALKTYHGELDGKKLEELRDALADQTPAVFVGGIEGDLRSVSLSRRRAVQQLVLELMVCVGTQRDQEARARGGHSGDAEPGAYQVLQDLRGKLMGWTPSTSGVGVIRPARERLLVNTIGLDVFVASYSADADVKTEAATGETDLTSIRARHRFPLELETLASGTGDALTFAAGIVTLTNAAGLFVAGHVGLIVKIEGAADANNNGEFTITARPGATQIQWANAAGVAEPSFAGTWKIRPQPFVQADAT